MRIESLRKLKVRNKNTNTKYGHTGTPESNIFSISLHRCRLVKAIKHNVEYDERMPKSVENPLHKQGSSEAISINSNLIQSWIRQVLFCL